MKYIIIGLGYFGSSLATKLTALGHEVIGVDNNMNKADELKNKITKVMVMDCTKPSALDSLPLSDVDAVIVAIGEDIGSSILTLALLKKQSVKRLIGRAINPVHQNILDELGIEEIVHPEDDTAEIFSSILMVRNAISILPVNDKNIIAELSVPEKYFGHTLDAVNMEERFGLKPVAVKIAPRDKGIGRLLKKDFQVDKECDRSRPLRQNDRLLVMGDIESIKRFIE